MKYKYITGEVLSISNPERWSSLDNLLEWWPETFVSGSKNDYGMKLFPRLEEHVQNLECGVVWRRNNRVFT